MNKAKRHLRALIHAALREDLLNDNDITTRLFTPPHTLVEAELIVKQHAVVAGLEVFRRVFKEIDPDIKVELLSHDGARVKKNKKIAYLRGKASSVMKGERLALNFISRLSGIATLTKKFVAAVKGTNAKIYDTRKTTPLLRALEKYAVRMGGGYNHRLGLYNAILVKDNHLKTLMLMYPTREKLRAYLKRGASHADVRRYRFEIEARNMEEFLIALELEPDIIMLDNSDEHFVKKALRIKRKVTRHKKSFPLLEVSGKIDTQKARVFSRLGVDMISIGSLTHSPRATDMALKITRLC